MFTIDRNGVSVSVFVYDTIRDNIKMIRPFPHEILTKTDIGMKILTVKNSRYGL